MLDKLDVILSIIDIIICIFDIGLMVYLFFYRFPQEMKKKHKFDKFGYYRNKRNRKCRSFPGPR